LGGKRFFSDLFDFSLKEKEGLILLREREMKREDRGRERKKGEGERREGEKERRKIIQEG